MRLEVRPDLRKQVTEVLKDSGVESRVFVKKAADIPTIIDIATTTTAVVLTLYEIWKKIKEREEAKRPSSPQNVNIFNIVIGNRTLSFEQYNVEHIILLLEQTGKIEGEEKR